jgi:hypothetical protein
MPIEPHHHLHISSFALLLIAMFVLGLLAIVFNFILNMRREKRREREPYNSALFREAPRRQESAGATGSSGYAPRSSSAGPAYSASPSAAAAPVYMHGSSSSDLLTGVLLGEAIAGGGRHDTTVIHDGGGYAPAPSYDPGPSCDSSPSYDSGISYDSGSSFGGGDSGGGVDISW